MLKSEKSSKSRNSFEPRKTKMKNTGVIYDGFNPKKQCQKQILHYLEYDE